MDVPREYSHFFNSSYFRDDFLFLPTVKTLDAVLPLEMECLRPVGPTTIAWELVVECRRGPALDPRRRLYRRDKTIKLQLADD